MAFERRVRCVAESQSHRLVFSSDVIDPDSLVIKTTEEVTDVMDLPMALSPEEKEERIRILREAMRGWYKAANHHVAGCLAIQRQIDLINAGQGSLADIRLRDFSDIIQIMDFPRPDPVDDADQFIPLKQRRVEVEHEPTPSPPPPFLQQEEEEHEPTPSPPPPFLQDEEEEQQGEKETDIDHPQKTSLSASSSSLPEPVDLSIENE